MTDLQDRPKPGDVIITKNGYPFNSWEVYRVIKAGKTMWEIEELNHLGYWTAPVRRKVGAWFLLAGDPIKAREKLISAQNERRESIKRADAALLAAVRKIAAIPLPSSEAPHD